MKTKRNTDRLRRQNLSARFNLRSVCSSWVRRYRAEAAAVVESGREVYQNTVDRMAEIRCNEDIFLLQEAKVKLFAARDHIVYYLVRSASHRLMPATSVLTEKMNRLLG